MKIKMTNEQMLSRNSYETSKDFSTESIGDDNDLSFMEVLWTLERASVPQCKESEIQLFSSDFAFAGFWKFLREPQFI